MASLGTPSLAGMSGVAGFKSDSPALSKVSDNSKGMLKIAAEMKSPLDGMVSFFSSIDKNIREVAEKIGEQTGISRLMAKIMGKDLKLEEEAAARDKRGRSIGGAKSGVKGEDVAPLGEGILASLKDAFDNLIPKQEIGELGKILLLATGALLLVKLAQKFSNLIAPVLEFFFETLIPGFQELNATIMSSPTGYLGIGGLVVSTTLLVQKYGATVRTFFTTIGKNLDVGSTGDNSIKIHGTGATTSYAEFKVSNGQNCVWDFQNPSNSNVWSSIKVKGITFMIFTPTDNIIHHYKPLVNSSDDRLN